jgi:hypothetical protein
VAEYPRVPDPPEPDHVRETALLLDEAITAASRWIAPLAPKTALRAAWDAHKAALEAGR